MLPQGLAGPEDPILGKRKASQITVDPEATPPADQKRKKRRKVGLDQPISAAADPTVMAETPEPEGGRTLTGETTRDVLGTSAATDVNHATIPPTQKKKKRKGAKAGQSDSTSMDLAEQHVEQSAEVASISKPPPAEASKTKRRKKTVVLDLSTVIPPPADAQVYPGPFLCVVINLLNKFCSGAFGYPIFPACDRAFAFHDGEGY